MSLPRCGLAVLVLFSALCPIAFGQATTTITQQTAASATSGLAQSLLALTGGQTITDAVLTGTITRTAGSAVETVPVKFEVKGFSESKIEFTSSAFVASEVSGLSGGIPACQWTDAKGTVHRVPTENCMNPVWFLPELSALGTVSATSTTVILVGSETYNGTAVDHYRLSQVFGTPKQIGSATFLGDVVKTDIYCDASTHLPVALGYTLHPDNNPSVDIVTEVRFSNYQPMNGMLLPMKVTKLMNGSVLLEATLTNAAVNVGLSDSEFTLQ